MDTAPPPFPTVVLPVLSMVEPSGTVTSTPPGMATGGAVCEFAVPLLLLAEFPLPLLLLLLSAGAEMLVEAMYSRTFCQDVLSKLSKFITLAQLPQNLSTESA
jgi:hypothetical protein